MGQRATGRIRDRFLGLEGEQMDDGTHEIIDNHTFVVSKEFPDVTFNYQIRGDTDHVRSSDSRFFARLF